MADSPITTVTTRVMAHECGEKCVDSIRNIFPDFVQDVEVKKSTFPVGREEILLRCDGVSPDFFMALLSEQRILDTALDSMALNLQENSTFFSISRQAALAGKVAFVLESEKTVGGVIDIEMEGRGLGEWLERVTWHPGRTEIPRNVGDDISMKPDGAVTEWFDSKGRATINKED